MSYFLYVRERGWGKVGRGKRCSVSDFRSDDQRVCSGSKLGSVFFLYFLFHIFSLHSGI